MVSEESKVVLYQKYAVADDKSHSSTIVPLTTGQSCQGSGYCKNQIHFIQIKAFLIKL